MKSPPWLLVPRGALEPGGTVLLDPAEARHVTGSLRRRPGDEIVLADGYGAVAEARLTYVRRGRVEAELLALRREPEPQSTGVTIAMAIVGNQAMDWAIQKAVEIGVRRFVPLEAERAQLGGSSARRRIEHWRRISMQALKQCHRPWAMEIADILSVAVLVKGRPGKGAVADRGGCAVDELPDDIGGVLAVGPEGGFTDVESEIFSDHGWARLRLGPYVLRAETAAVVGAATMVAREENR